MGRPVAGRTNVALPPFRQAQIGEPQLDIHLIVRRSSACMSTRHELSAPSHAIPGSIVKDQGCADVSATRGIRIELTGSHQSDDNPSRLATEISSSTSGQ